MRQRAALVVMDVLDTGGQGGAAIVQIECSAKNGGRDHPRSSWMFPRGDRGGSGNKGGDASRLKAMEMMMLTWFGMGLG